MGPAKTPAGRAVETLLQYPIDDGWALSLTHDRRGWVDRRSGSHTGGNRGRRTCDPDHPGLGADLPHFDRRLDGSWSIWCNRSARRRRPRLDSKTRRLCPSTGTDRFDHTLGQPLDRGNHQRPI